MGGGALHEFKINVNSYSKKSMLKDTVLPESITCTQSSVWNAMSEIGRGFVAEIFLMQLEHCSYLLGFFTSECLTFCIHDLQHEKQWSPQTVWTHAMFGPGLPTLKEDVHVMFWLRCRKWTTRPRMYTTACIKQFPRFLSLRRESGELGFSCNPWFLPWIPSLWKSTSDLLMVAFA